MKLQEVVRRKQRLDNLFKQVAEYFHDPELQAHWARYLCVLVSGYIEVSIRMVYSAYAKKRAHETVAVYVERQLSEFRNPNMERILAIAGSFSSVWEAQLREKTEGELKDAVDSIVANRHKIAHGDDVAITYTRVQKYYQDAEKVLGLISGQCGM